MIKFIKPFTGTLVFSLLCFVSSGQSSHPHTNTPIQLTSISSLSVGAYQVASICFLGSGNCGNDVGFGKGDGYEIDTANQCISEGYKRTRCAVPHYLFGQCPYNDIYYTKCILDKDRACTEGGYLEECEDGQIAGEHCLFDSTYQKCKCDPCEGYDYNYAQATATGYVADGSCMSCRLPKYKRKPNPCSGYTTCECGGAIGTTTCTTGTQTKYQSCKSCCENKCTLSECPENHDCDYEACSNKYCDKGCKSDYNKCTLSECPENHDCDYETCSNKYCDKGCKSDYVEWCNKPTMNCNALGYRLQSCIEGELLCPFDATYKFCL